MIEWMDIWFDIIMISHYVSVYLSL